VASTSSRCRPLAKEANMANDISGTTEETYKAGEEQQRYELQHETANNYYFLPLS